LKVKPAKSSLTGIPDYYTIYLRWNRKYEETGKSYCKKMARHYAKIAVEFGQAEIEND